MKTDKVIIAVLTGMIRLYKAVVSPVLPPSCRFTPTCSMYAMDALRRHGPVRGTYLSVMRVVRCNPFCKGGFDPVP